MPGLYSVFKIFDRETDEWYKYWTFGLITRVANSLMEQIHNDGDNAGCMPLFLPFDLSKRWLEEDLSDQPNEYQAILEYEFPSEELEYKTVWKIRTGKARPDGRVNKDEEFVWEEVKEISFD